MKRIQNYNASFTEYLIDEIGKVGKNYGAKITPHYFIIDTNGKLIYSGAIDDKPNTNKKDIAFARNYLREVLNAILSGQTQPLQELNHMVVL